MFVFALAFLACSSVPRESQVPAVLDIHLVMDNYGTHKTASIRSWLARHPRIHVHFTPTSASWLNQVERWFATLTQRCIRRGTHRSTRQLKQAIREYLDINNAKPANDDQYRADLIANAASN